MRAKMEIHPLRDVSSPQKQIMDGESAEDSGEEVQADIIVRSEDHICGRPQEK